MALKTQSLYNAVEAQTSLAPLSWFTRNCACAPILYIFQSVVYFSYVKTVPSQMNLTMKLTMREPASMTTDT